MRLNFTGRRKIQKQHAAVVFRDDPVGSNAGHYFELRLDLASYKLPPEARLFVEATHKLTLMRFDLGRVDARLELTPAQRRLSEFDTDDLDSVRFRVKVVQPDGPDAGALLAEADGLHPEAAGSSYLIRVAGDANLGEAPYRLELVETDPDLPVLYLNTRIGGKTYASDPVGKPLLLTAAAREIFRSLVQAGDHSDEPDHWACLWERYATQVLKMDEVPDESDSADVRQAWIDRAIGRFAEQRGLVKQLELHMARLEIEALEEAN